MIGARSNRYKLLLSHRISPRSKIATFELLANPHPAPQNSAVAAIETSRTESRIEEPTPESNDLATCAADPSAK